MAVKVSNLKIYLQKNSDNLYVASWDFNTSSGTTSTTSSNIKKGDWVTIKSSCTKYYNGVSMPSWVKNYTWKVYSVSGSRVVINESKTGGYKIMSPVDIKYLTKAGSSSSSSSSTITASNLDHYNVYWYYGVGDGKWYADSGNPSNSGTKKYDTYSPPSNAGKVKVTVKPISKTHKVNNKDTAYWTAESVSATYNINKSDPPDVPPTPTVEFDKYRLTATVEGISDSKTDKIEFQIYDGTEKFASGIAEVDACMASFSKIVNEGGNYRVRCRAINEVSGTNLYSDWTAFTSGQSAPPGATEIIYLGAKSETSVYITWTSVDSADSYEIKYATEKEDLQANSNQVQTITVSDGCNYLVGGLESGQEYFFCVRSTNDQGSSIWSSIRSVILGKSPAAPTTWSSTTTVVAGEPLMLYWVHNSRDNSSETKAQLELTIDGVLETHEITKSTDEDEKDKTSFYTIDTSIYTEGTTIEWRVCTAGVTGSYGDWSVQRTVDVYGQPTLAFRMIDVNGNDVETLTSFPFYISGIAGPSSQTPTGYHLTVISNETYETLDNIGNEQMIGAGEEIYSQYFDISEDLYVMLSANSINLDNDKSYKITCTVSMNSGLSAEESLDFSVSWTDSTYETNAEITIDSDIYAAYIRPYCEAYSVICYVVTYASKKYTRTEDTIDDPDGEMVLDAYTTTDEEVYSYTDADGNTAYYCRVYVEEEMSYDNVLLSVYRREFDGTFTEIATDVKQSINEYVLDPHPALDYARYRVVAIDQTTGAVSYSDIPGYPIDCPYVIVQWDEEWDYFSVDEEDLTEEQPWSGSMLKLPFNIDVAEDNSPDITLTEYIGRSHPVSYYGTQLGSTATWNVDIPKSDKETLYGLRCLQRYMGDVYVREPSGSGYWANIKVSFNQKHTVLVIPVTLTISRVEGGM